MEHAAPHVKWAIEIAFNLGVRTGPSELLSLQWKYIDWENGTIRVFGSKTNRWRTIPLNPEFMDRLEEMFGLAKTEFLVEYHGKPIKSLHNGFRHACERAGIGKDIISYDIRHLFCSTLFSKSGACVRVTPDGTLVDKNDRRPILPRHGR